MITAANTLAAHNRSHVPSHPVHATEAETDQADQCSRGQGRDTGKDQRVVAHGGDDGAAHGSRARRRSAPPS